MDGKIDEIISKESLSQVDALIAKLKEAEQLNNSINQSPLYKLRVFTELLQVLVNTTLLDPPLLIVIQSKIKDIISTI